MDGRSNNKGTLGNKGGNPGSDKLHFVARRVTEYEKIWWEKWVVMMDSDDKPERMEAMREFNKLQCKMIPQQIGGLDGGPLTIEIVNYAKDKATL